MAGGPPVDAPMAMSRGGATPSLRDVGAGTGSAGGAKVPDMVPTLRVRAARSVKAHHAQLRHQAHLLQELVVRCCAARA